MAKEHGKRGRSPSDPFAPASPDAFAARLEQRRRAAQGLEQDLLTEVPLLYGSAGDLPQGDPGIVLAKAHREELVRRNGGGVLRPSSRRSEVRLPFERLMAALLVLFLLFVFFMSPD